MMTALDVFGCQQGMQYSDTLVRDRERAMP